MNDLEKVQKTYVEALAKYSKDIQDALKAPTVREYLDKAAKAHIPLGIASRAYRMIQEPKMILFDEDDDHMTIEEFKEYVDGGMFIDEDGSGNYATETEVSDIDVYPSDVEYGLRRDFTHVVWYNK